VLLVVAGCRDTGVVRRSITSTLGERIPGTQLDLVPDKDDVRIRGEGKPVLVRGPLKVGTILDVPLEGRRCIVELTFVGQDTETDYRADTKKPTTRDLRTRTFRTFSYEFRCSDGPVPGSPSALAGGDPRRAAVWLLPCLVLGILAGLMWARASRPEVDGGFALVALLAIAVAFAGAIVLAVMFTEDVFRVTYALLYAGFTLAALYAGYVWHERRDVSIASVLAPIAGAAAIIATHATWTFAGPLAALGCAAGAWLVVVVTVVMVRSK
jgi:hypothetical protein